MNKDMAIIKLAALAYRGHYYCEDTWYNCPKHPEGSTNEYAGTECTCGTDEHNLAVQDIINAIL